MMIRDRQDPRTKQFQDLHQTYISGKKNGIHSQHLKISDYLPAQSPDVMTSTERGIGLKSATGVSQHRQEEEDTSEQAFTSRGTAQCRHLVTNCQSCKYGQLLLVEVTPLSLGFGTADGVMSTLIERNTIMPVQKTRIFTTHSDNQTTLRISLFEGERIMTKDNNMLGTFDLCNIPPLPRGVAQIEVTLYVNTGGILMISATEKSTNKEQIVSVTNILGRMSADEIERLVLEAERYKTEAALVAATAAVSSRERSSR